MSHKTRSNYATGFKECTPNCICIICKRKRTDKRKRAERKKDEENNRLDKGTNLDDKSG